MTTKPKFKLILITVFSVAVLVGGFYFQFNEDKSGNTLSDELFGWKYPVVRFPITGPNDIAYSDIRDPGGIPEGLPVRLKIPVIGVDSAIEDALITPDGRMDVPQGSVNVAWFALGPKPGKVGSAVIGGHFGMRSGVPFVFYKLDQLDIGDKVYVLDDRGKTLAFVVRSIKLFDRNADATTVFTSKDGLAHLNLITCEGIWNRINNTYPQRRVVFTDAISSEGSVSVPQKITTFPRPLSFGAYGADVVALQTSLEKKGFLVMPPRSTKGYFGTLTRSAVAQYQLSVGLPSNGIFGPSTIGRLISDDSSVLADPDRPSATHGPTLPSTAITRDSYYLFQLGIESIKSLYATPRDGFFTTLLIMGIIFMSLKINSIKNGVIKLQ